MLQGTAEKMHPLDTLSITSARKQSFAGYLLDFIGGKKESNHSFPDLVPPRWAFRCLGPPAGLPTSPAHCQFNLLSLHFLSC